VSHFSKNKNQILTQFSSKSFPRTTKISEIIRLRQLEDVKKAV
jgi:hypothetical protein